MVYIANSHPWLALGIIVKCTGLLFLVQNAFKILLSGQEYKWVVRNWLRVVYIWVIDQVWGQDGWMLAKFACLWTETEVHKLAKKEWGQYPAMLSKQTLAIKDLLYGFWGNFSFGIQQAVPSRQEPLARSGSQSHRTIWFILPVCCV